MRYLIQHETILTYPNPVREHHLELRLTPRQDANQRLISHRIELEPSAERHSYRDYFGNAVDYFCLIAPQDSLTTRLTAEVETLQANPFDFVALEHPQQKEWYAKELRQTPALYDYLLHRSSLTPAVMKLAAAVSCALPRHEPERPILESLVELMAWVPQILRYESGSTAVHNDLLEALKQGGGVCQDFAHLFISVVRSWQLPCRYVMGYMDSGIYPEGEPIATHAWAEVLIPGGGWIGFDPVHNLLANDRYIPVAVGRDSYDAAPQRGSFKGDTAGTLPQVNLTISNQ
ncbi:MAG: transglutaminase family protein [Trichlorobacter sp.]|uniref:transglutaminase family protein n=1 Tax=Trichlorobacter sp. TaxID=2911007 RepID=UPI00256A1D96|nr:transglutaminase family protein [Trichlorobacter sp.]MDK9717372.1 transglutaminase family protein [Trichlorobacter sp.]